MNQRWSGFALLTSITLTTYFVIAAATFHSHASTPADDAAVDTLAILSGGLALLSFCFFCKWSADGDDARVSGEIEPLDQLGEGEHR